MKNDPVLAACSSEFAQSTLEKEGETGEANGFDGSNGPHAPATTPDFYLLAAFRVSDSLTLPANAPLWSVPAEEAVRRCVAGVARELGQPQVAVYSPWLPAGYALVLRASAVSSSPWAVARSTPLLAPSSARPRRTPHPLLQALPQRAPDHADLLLCLSSDSPDGHAPLREHTARAMDSWRLQRGAAIATAAAIARTAEARKATAQELQQPTVPPAAPAYLVLPEA